MAGRLLPRAKANTARATLAQELGDISRKDAKAQSAAAFRTVFFASLRLCARKILRIQVADRGGTELAAITLLHWNISQFSNNKLNDNNGTALINYIAQVVSQSDANIISLLELKNSAVNNIVARLIPAINLANREDPAAPNQWRAIGIDSQKNNEAYVILYKLNSGFVPFNAAGPGGGQINGLTNQSLTPAGAPGGQLRFNATLTKAGGRKPYYVAFSTTDQIPKFFSIVAYHTMFGLYSTLGVRNVGMLAQSRAISYEGVPVNMQASLTCGDFNVDFDLNRAAYDFLLNNVPSSQTTDEKTTLVNFTPPGGYPTSREYRGNAYDNIFKYDRAGRPPAGGGGVVDLIYESTVPPVGDGLMAPETGAFVAGPIPNGNLIQNIPPQNFEDAWHIVRHAISDHLPVWVNFII
jgi:hypothetical protein